MLTYCAPWRRDLVRYAMSISSLRFVSASRVVLSCVATHTAMRGQGVLSGLCNVTKDMYGRRLFSLVNAVRFSPSSQAFHKNHAHSVAGP
jgi:hypothetical protein